MKKKTNECTILSNGIIVQVPYLVNKIFIGTKKILHVIVQVIFKIFMLTINRSMNQFAPINNGKSNRGTALGNDTIVQVPYLVTKIRRY